MGGVAGLLLCLVAGFAAIRFIWPAGRRWSGHDPLRLALAPALGLGLLSCCFFGVRLVLGLSRGASVAAMVLLTMLLAGLAWWRAGDAPEETFRTNPAPAWVRVSWGVITLMALGTFWILIAIGPHGEWDAWSIWDLRARFLYRMVDLDSPFHPALAWSRTGSPLLLPAAIAGLWTMQGSEAQWIPAAVAFCFLAGTLTVPVLVLQRLRGSTIALTAGMLLAGTAVITRSAGSLSAEVPLTFYCTAAVSLAVFALLKKETGWPPVFLAGVQGGLAAWTKNDGLLFCVALTIGFLVFSQGRFRLVLALLGGMLAVLSVVGHFHYWMAPPQDLLSAEGSAPAPAVLAGVGQVLLLFDGWILPPVLLLGGLVGLMGIHKSWRGPALLPLTVAILQLLSYVFLAAAGTGRPDWYMPAVAERLILSVWPAVVSGILLLVRVPGGTEISDAA